MSEINLLEQNFNALSNDVKDLKTLIANGFKKVDANFDSVKKEIDILHAKVELLSKKLDSLDSTTNNGFGEVGLKLENLTDEITKISIVTSYDEQFKNMKGLN